MAEECKNQATDIIFQLKCSTALEKNILPKKRNIFLRRVLSLFKRVKIDKRILKETMEITFWK